MRGTSLAICRMYRHRHGSARCFQVTSGKEGGSMGAMATEEERKEAAASLLFGVLVETMGEMEADAMSKTALDMEKEHLQHFVEAFVPDATKAAAVMSDLAKIQDGNVAAASSDKSSSGAGLYRKGSDPFANSHSKKDNSHGGSKSGGGAQGRGKAKRGVPVKAGKDLGSLHSALRPGRQVCYCNARRHALLHNCLSCGKVICEQEGEGACLFCGGDPHAEGSSAAAIAEASRRAERLLEFDRSAAKRTAVIDDQADYFGHAAADVWLSEQERAAAAEAQQARDAAAERRRRELRVTLDFD
eukprot:53881-Pleurochrysis_carterae.AAC.2